ncbi:MAG: bifunctional hydroxymethylpyrimidine kinase/phosphomethylpyrimidine kinase [Desulfobacca sp.]|uniref:bifunctional hydroxymethylpyrimidine kinase/phosphomethylpyrimidine kinase n=1 Tax=Desulfobacca sp. TaxID=2067990 RepID=UPI00404B2F4B
MRTVLLIAGSDSSAGAGIQQDLKVATLLGVYGLTVITAVTAQNSLGVQRWEPVAPDLVAAQLTALCGDIRVDAVKIGMLATAAIVREVAASLRQLTVPIVVDPVLAASDGSPLLSEEGVVAFREDLLPLATVLTPNLAEASRLLGREIGTVEAMVAAAQDLCRLGPRAVLVKGGHLTGAPVDVLAYGDQVYQLPGERLTVPHTHGTGCAMAAALAAHLARGEALPEAVNQARALVGEAIRWGLPLGQGRGPVNTAAPFLREQERLKVLQALQAAAARLQAEDITELIPEVQSNLGYATPYPRGVMDVAAFPGRLLRTPEGLLIPREPAFGASRHIAAVILTAQQSHPQMRAAMNIRFIEEVEALALLLHLKTAHFDRSQEPPEVKAREGSTLAWGVATVMSPGEPPPDLIYDRGDWGKEAMIRVLGTDPMDVVSKVLALQQALAAGRR